MDLSYTFRKVSVFLFLYLTGISLAGLGAAITHKPSLHFALRRFHGGTGDFFFGCYTHLGTIFVLIAAVLLFLSFRRWKTAASIGTAFALASLVAQGLKHLLQLPRPWFYFEQLSKSMPAHANLTLWVPEGVDLASKTSPSFPSGHAATAAVLFLGLTFFAGQNHIAPTLQRLIQIICLGALALVAYSRVYLSFHFIEDVLVGSLIGVLATCLTFPFVDYLWYQFSFPLGKDRFLNGV
ncbi:MAG: phosphatase PAP2 family protein [Puniceicoccales bacterium]|jgi:membrane-associated phospholipid phosphatase|nr:phosphatase PAP2 family protein [Puniceicoccales bacterium]